MGLARGDAACCSTERRRTGVRFLSQHSTSQTVAVFGSLPAGMMTDRAVAEADLMTLVPGRELRFSPSAESCWWRTLLSTRSVVAPRGPCVSGSPRTAPLPGRGSNASEGLSSFSVEHDTDPA